MTRRLAGLALVALIGAGCGGAHAPSGGGHTTPAATKRGKAMRFSACMRENGVREFPDPDAAGALTIDAIANGTSLDIDSAAFKQALSTCQHLEPPGFTGRKRSAGQQEHALRFAQCIRDHGVKDFPDPTPGEPLVDTRRIPSAARPGGMDVLNAAMRACRDTAAGLVKRP
jgi:hypothetical protein